VQAKTHAPVIEVVTLKLKPELTAAQFDLVDREVQTQYIAKRPGFLSRESAPGSDHNWLVIVHWRSLADAEASMKSFPTAPAAAKFMSLMVPNSMLMTRYSR
jgi:hypothetical protein